MKRKIRRKCEATRKKEKLAWQYWSKNRFESQVQSNIARRTDTRRRCAYVCAEWTQRAEESSSKIIFQSVYYKQLLLFLEHRLALGVFIALACIFWMSMLKLVSAPHIIRTEWRDCITIILTSFSSQIGCSTFEPCGSAMEWFFIHQHAPNLEPNNSVQLRILGCYY